MQEIFVKGQKVGVLKIDGKEYISLTDLARYKNSAFPGDVIIKWMSNKSSFDFYSLWEELFNENFKLAEFREFKNDSANQSFTMSPSRWISSTNSIGFISKRGRYDGGTYAHSDIALEFASWIDPAFKLYLIKEFQRLKKREAADNKIEWNISRFLTKINYALQTESIKNNIVPKLTEKQKKYIYASEADVLNVALFGMTAKEWRESNPDLKGNIRDNTDILHLVILNNLENINSEMIEMKVSQSNRLIKLNEIARRQMNLLSTNSSLNNLKYIDNNK